MRFAPVRPRVAVPLFACSAPCAYGLLVCCASLPQASLADEVAPVDLESPFGVEACTTSFTLLVGLLNEVGVIMKPSRGRSVASHRKCVSQLAWGCVCFVMMRGARRALCVVARRVLLCDVLCCNA